MDRSASDHPPRERLRDFLHGTLDQALSEQVEEHILHCAACCETLGELHAVADPWLQPLGQPDRSNDDDARHASADGPASAHADAPGEQAAGTWIGPYRLVRLLGEGGMGRVYLAQQQQPVRRSVALKLIKAGIANRQLVARFEAERQALALMEHPNIPHVLDVGMTPDGRHYFVTELIAGLPITEYCGVHRLTVRERLALFLPVCHAVQHAHHKAVVHRDLKPSNVLVCQRDGESIPKVIDFGIAKALDDPSEQGATRRESYTRYGQIVGTLEYMSPEQAALNRDDVDTRSDVYALGVLLYELLTGTTPLPSERARSQPLDET
ncbi:MAG: protein kinase, partial [Pirellulaceae bacterium]|nr:protein kinase [Pirellulaceae bacterium]